jgi:hypothetical protein
MLEIVLPSHASDVDAKSCWQHCCRVMLATMLQLKVVRLCNPRAQNIEVLSHHKEVRYSCWPIVE